MTTSEITTGNDRPRTDDTPLIDAFDSPQLAPPAGHYSHIATHRGVAYISGQLPVAPDGSPWPASRSRPRRAKCSATSMHAWPQQAPAATS